MSELLELLERGQRGGVVKNISSLRFSATNQRIADHVRNYVETMNLLGKRPRCIALFAKDFEKLCNAVAKSAGLKREEITGLTHDGIPIQPTGG